MCCVGEYCDITSVVGVNEIAWLSGIVSGIPQSASTVLLMHGVGRKLWIGSGLLWMSLLVAIMKTLSLFWVV